MTTVGRGLAVMAAAVLVTVSLGVSVPAAAADEVPSPPRVSAVVADDSPLEPTPQPSPTESVTPPPSPDPTPTPTPTPDPTTPEPTPIPTPTPAPTPAPPSPSPDISVTPIPAVPPGIATSTVSPTTLVIALAVLGASILILLVLIRRRAPEPQAVEERPTISRTPAAVVLDALTGIGQAMMGSGYPAGLVRDALEDIATANGAPSTEVIVFPTSILVSTDDGGSSLTRAVSAGDTTYTLAQIEGIDEVQRQARTRHGSAGWAMAELARVVSAPPSFTRVQRLAAYPLIAGSISVLLGASWAGVALAAVLGVGVGALLIFGERVSNNYNALIVVGAALGVSLVGLLAARTSLDPGVLASVVAPLVMLLPGGLLTTAVIELATGHIMSGAARAAAGAMRLLLLAVGIVGAGALVGVPQIELDRAGNPLGPIAPWIAVAVFGVGIAIFQSARPRAIGWILIVLYVAYGAQVVGDLFLDGILSALVGAAAMTPVAIVVAAQRSGPPAIVSFLPAFWLLVPGALGLVGVTAVLDGTGTGGSTIATTLATMVAIALGVLIGLAATSPFRNRGRVQLNAVLGRRERPG